MNSRELIAAAKAVQQAVKQPSDDDIMDCSKLCSDEQILTLVDHVLATVRDDDDKLIDNVWLETVQEDAAERFPEFCWLGRLWRYEDAFPNVKTRGDFRELCRLLGVELKEPQR